MDSKIDRALSWVTDKLLSNKKRWTPMVHGPMLNSLMAAEYKCWELAMDIRMGKNSFKGIPLDQRLLMCSGVEYSIIEIKSMIEDLNNLPR